jgi:hypothetical protein
MQDRLAPEQQTQKPAEPANGPAPGLISVDGVDHAINNDTASHHPNHAELGGAQIEAGKSKYVHVHFQSPGQVSAGQELDIKNK